MHYTFHLMKFALKSCFSLHAICTRIFWPWNLHYSANFMYFLLKVYHEICTNFLSAYFMIFALRESWILHYVIWWIFSYKYISMNFALCDLINFFLRIYIHEFCTMWFDQFFPTNIFPWILHYVIWSIFSYEYLSMNFALRDLINFFLQIYSHEFCTTWDSV